MPDIKVKALAAFQYAKDGRTVRDIAEGDAFDADARHYPGLLSLGMVEPVGKPEEADALGAEAMAGPPVVAPPEPEPAPAKGGKKG